MSGLQPFDPAGLVAWRPTAPLPPAPVEAAPAAALGALVWRPMIRQRNTVRFLTARSWSAEARPRDIGTLKAAKRAAVIPAEIVAGAAADLARLLGPLVGVPGWWSVSNVATGHSRRVDSFARQLAEAVATNLGVPHLQVFEDRFVDGVSHPKEFAKLPPLVWHTRPTVPVLLVDDVVTSGWHLEEALTQLTGAGVPALGAAWIGGTVTGS